MQNALLTSIRGKVRGFILPLADLRKFLNGYVFERCLDVGAGTGLLLKYFYDAKLIKKGIGVEIDDSYFKQFNEDLSIVSTSALHNDEIFDLIMFNDVLHHVRDERAFLNEYCSKYLKKGGYVFIKEMDPSNFFYKYFNKLHDLIFARQVISEVSKGDLLQMMSEYEVVKSGKKRVFMYSHYWVLFRK